MGKHSFLAKLRRVHPVVRDLAPNASLELTLVGTFGRYHVNIGAEYSPTICRRRKLRMNSRPLTIRGILPHLCMEDNTLQFTPTPNAIAKQLGHIIVIRNISVQAHDDDGCGLSAHGSVDIEQLINLADERSLLTLQNMQKSGELTTATYHMMQHDILRTLRDPIARVA